ncbi:response regulator [Deinococcus pimensis]|uniref:response regulator n=1 Tax=Deinococcus pimensis TaxID=309888 RepID=UPI000487E44C|nr:response regulator [Deinococcus pimensis]
MTDRPTVLLVEDDEHATALTRRAFEEHGRFDVVTAETGRAALDALAPGRTLPELVVLDLGLPDMPGLDVLEAIKTEQRTAWLPVVVLTVSSDQHDLIRAAGLGASYFVTKPATYAEFVEAATSISAFWSTLALTPRPPRPRF